MARPSSVSGFTLVELLVVFAIIAFLLSMSLAAVGGLRQAAANVQCKNGMRQFGVAFMSYNGDNRGIWPNGRWNDQLQEQFTSSGMSLIQVVRLARCPAKIDAFLVYTGVYYDSINGPYRDGYPPAADKWPFAWAWWGAWWVPKIQDSRIYARSTKVVMSEMVSSGYGWGSQALNDRRGSRMHTTGGNFLAADGHVQFLPLGKVARFADTGNTIPGFHTDTMWAPYSTVASKFMP